MLPAIGGAEEVILGFRLTTKPAPERAIIKESEDAYLLRLGTALPAVQFLGLCHPAYAANISLRMHETQVQL